jgi:hypothetical protein
MFVTKAQLREIRIKSIHEAGGLIESDFPLGEISLGLVGEMAPQYDRVGNYIGDRYELRPRQPGERC